MHNSATPPAPENLTAHAPQTGLPKSHSPETGPEDDTQLSGLAQMQKMLDGLSPPPPIAAVLNYRLSEVAEGRVVFSGTPQAAFANPTGAIHGGWYGTLLDSCMACAVLTRLPARTAFTTLEYKVNVLRSVPAGVEVAAIGTAQHVGRSTGVAVGELRGVKDGKLYATGSTTCIVMQPPAQDK